MSCIIDNALYLGGCDDLTASFLSDHRIKTIINVAKECNDILLGHMEIQMFKYEFTDTINSIYTYIEDIVELIEKQLTQGAVIIHCYAGVSRSATFVLAYLMKAKEWNLCEAFSYVMDKRQIKPNPMFIRDLMRYEEDLYDTRSFQFIYDEYTVDYIVNASGIRDKCIKYIRAKYREMDRDVLKTMESIEQDFEKF